MQSSNGPQTENDGFVMCDDVAIPLLEALGIHEPVAKIEIILSAMEPVEMKITYVSHYKIGAGIYEMANSTLSHSIYAQ